MHQIVGISFNNKGKVYNFEPIDLDLNQGDRVIVETEKGLQLGYVVTGITSLDDSKMVSEIKPVLRLASEKDILTYEKNIKDATKTLEKARELALELSLEMKLIDACYTFDRKQLLFNFLADERVDFRELAKRLAQLYHTRIELRQIGVRDKAKEIGGLGPCGRVLCCNSFLNDISGITINMAKNQSLALNPTKINGVCGRLLCCLGYEDEVYTNLKKQVPSVGEYYKSDNLSGRITEVNIFTKKIKVLKSENEIVEVQL